MDWNCKCRIWDMMLDCVCLRLQAFGSTKGRSENKKWIRTSVAISAQAPRSLFDKRLMASSFSYF